MTAEEAPDHAAAGNVKIDVTGAGIRVTGALRAQVDRRVLLALSRFGRQVRGVDVRVATLVNPLGGFDQQCRMRASLQVGGDVRAEVIDGRIAGAVGRAAARLAVRVASALDGGPREAARLFEPAPLRGNRRRAGATPWLRGRR